MIHSKLLKLKVGEKDKKGYMLLHREIQNNSRVIDIWEGHGGYKYRVTSTFTDNKGKFLGGFPNFELANLYVIALREIKGDYNDEMPVV